MTLGDDFRNAISGGGGNNNNGRVPQGKTALYICQELEKQYNFAYIDNELRYYKDGWYQPGGEDYVKMMLQLMIPDISQSNLREAIAKLEQRNYRSIKECDVRNDILNVENGLLDMNEMKLMPHDPEYLSIVQFPHKFVQKPKSKRIRKLFTETLNEKELRKLQLMLGDLLYFQGHKQTIFFFVGSGHNRKGTVTRLIQHFVGPELYCNLSLEELADRNFAVVNLYGKLLNVTGDDSPNAPENWNIIRRISGADTLSGEIKGVQKRVSFRNKAIIICVFNKLPQIDEDYATWRRIQLIRFQRNFEENDDGEMGEDFEAKLHTEERMSELLWFALQGRKMFLKNGGHEKEDLESIKLEYKKMQDHVVAFTSECYVKKADGYTDTEIVYNDYVDYCKNKNQSPLAKKELGEKLAIDSIPNRKRKVGTKKDVHCYIGVVRKTDGFFGDGTDG